MKPRYIAHTGKKQPVDDDVIVEVVHRDSTVSGNDPAADWADRLNWWVHGEAMNPRCDIIAYRVIENEG